MPTLVPLSKSQHAGYYWKPYLNFSFTETDTLSPIVVSELPKAALTAPVAFIMKNQNCILVMLQGMSNNSMVTEDGRWVGGYIPSCYRSYPFISVRGKDGQQVLCFDQKAGLVYPEEQEGSLPLLENGDLSPKIRELAKFIHTVEKNRILTAKICELINQYELLVPWELSITVGDTKTPVNGLFTVDELKLRKLSDEQLRNLINIGAMGVIYAHLLSKGQVSVLSRLVELKKRIKPAEQEPTLETLSEMFDDNDETLSFNF